MSEKIEHSPGTSSLHASRHRATRLLSVFISMLTIFIILLAFTCGAMLLLRNTPFLLLHRLQHALLSAAPLLFIGFASLCFQIVMRDKPFDLFKALLVSAAFILWGIDQLLPGGWFATTLNDVVIVLYVIDLGWMMLDRLKPHVMRKPFQQKMQRYPDNTENTGSISTIDSTSGPSQDTSGPSFAVKRYHLLPMRNDEQTSGKISS